MELKYSNKQADRDRGEAFRDRLTKAAQTVFEDSIKQTCRKGTN